MQLTADEFKVACVMADYLGFPRAAGMSPAQYVKHLCNVEEKAEKLKAEKPQSGNVIPFPGAPLQESQLSLPLES